MFLQGILRFLDEKSWFFDGELWCFCGRIVVLKCTNLNGEKCATVSNFIFQQGSSGHEVEGTTITKTAVLNSVFAQRHGNP
jgi:hypothetical protein